MNAVRFKGHLWDSALGGEREEAEYVLATDYAALAASRDRHLQSLADADALIAKLEARLAEAERVLRDCDEYLVGIPMSEQPARDVDAADLRLAIQAALRPSDSAIAGLCLVGLCTLRAGHDGGHKFPPVPASASEVPR
jgi:hypothetical protein